MNTRPIRPWLLAALLLLAAAGLQDQPVIPDLPDDLKPFWEDYWPAKQADDEEAMDKAVRLAREKAEFTLNLLLDEYCAKPRDGLRDELRTLAWSMDRVERGERYIARVRFVLDLEDTARLQRLGLMNDLYRAEKEFGYAIEDKAGDAEFERVGQAFADCATGFEKLGDLEFAIRSLVNVADIELRRNRQWDRAVAFKRIVELGGRLEFKDASVESSATELERLRGLGFDPDRPRPEAGAPLAEGAGDGAAGAPTATPAGGKGRTLDAFAPGSAAVVVKLQPDLPKKGYSGLVLPSFAPLENHFLWAYTFIAGTGPTPFDGQRGAVALQPGGQRWQLLRDGTTFLIDSDGDGRGDVTVPLSTTPQRVEVPLPGGGTWPIMACVPDEREQQFGLELNYAPQVDSARVRFHLAGGRRGQVLGEEWLLLDSNLSGVYGDHVEQYGDGFTATSNDLPTLFREPDAVQLGKARITQPFSTVMPVGGRFHRASITPDGSELTLRELALEAGAVKLDLSSKAAPTHVLIEEIGGALPGAVLNVVPPKKGGSVPVPAGRWQVVMGRLESGTKTGLKQVRIYRGRAEPFDVEPGKTVTLALGAPYQVRFQPPAGDVSTQEGETTIRFGSLRIFGRGGEEYALLHDEPLQPEVEIVGPDGKKHGKPSKTLLPDLALWQAAGEGCLYFPAPLSVPELKDAGSHVFRLSQKQHGLLGGPLGPEPAPGEKAGSKP